MATQTSEVVEQVRVGIEGSPTDRFIERLASVIGGRASVQAVFGEPVERGDVTVIPVARVRWGFGGGTGLMDAGPTPGSGSGGGGAASADPAGYIEIGPDGTSFRPIISAYPSPFLVLAGAVAFGIMLRAISRLIRG